MAPEVKTVGNGSCKRIDDKNGNESGKGCDKKSSNRTGNGMFWNIYE